MLSILFKNNYIVKLLFNGKQFDYVTKASSRENAILNVLNHSLSWMNPLISRKEMNLELLVEASWLYEELCAYKAAMDHFLDVGIFLGCERPDPQKHGLFRINESNYLKLFNMRISVLPSEGNQYQIQTSETHEYFLCEPVIATRKQIKQLSKIFYA